MAQFSTGDPRQRWLSFGPALTTFANPDRLSQAEAEQIRSWATSQPTVMKALRQPGNDEHASVRLFQSVVDHFAQHHPQSAGEPAPWAEGRLLDDHTPIAEMSAGEAEARLAWASTRSEYRTTYMDKSSPDHDLLVQQTLALREKISGGAQPEPQTIGEPDPVSAEALERIDRVGNDPAYREPTHPGHQAAMKAMEAAYTQAFPEPGSNGPGVAESREANFQAQTRAVQEHAAYADRRHPLHGTKVAEMSALFDAHYAEQE